MLGMAALYLANKYWKMLGIYMGKFATSEFAMTGKTYLPHADYLEGPCDCTGNPMDSVKALGIKEHGRL
jgi:hypothetical protein